MKKKFIDLRHKAKFIVLIITILALTFSGIIIKNNLNVSIDSKSYTILQKEDNLNKINVKGQVISDEISDIYTTSGNVVKEIKVKLGDKVKSGDVLALLDTVDLQKDIQQTEATLKTAETINKIKLDTAKEVYDSALKLSEEGSNSEIINAECAVNAAKLDLDDKKNTYQNNKTLFECDAIAQKELNESEISLKNAEDSYDKALVALDNIKAKISLDVGTAKENYEVAKLACEDKTQEIALERKKQQLLNCTVVAPIDGIISSINAVVGRAAIGNLFEIQNLNNLIVISSVKEGDIDKIKLNQRVEIKTDSTGDEIINGKVARIEEIANKQDSNALTVENGSNNKEAKFQIRIKIDNENYKLKIGMKARINIILDEENNVYTVLDKSLIKDKDNNYFLYIAEKQGTGYVVESISVTKGKESDSEVEVIGNNIKDGIIVLNSPLNYVVGQTIKIENM